MTQVIINGKVIATIKGQPHGELRAKIIDAMLDGKKVEIKEV